MHAKHANKRIFWKGNDVPNSVSTGTIYPTKNKDNTILASYSASKPFPMKHMRQGYNPDQTHRAHTAFTHSRMRVSTMQDRPGAYIQNTSAPMTEEENDCLGTTFVSNVAPIHSLSETPNPLIGQSKVFCCNKEKDAKHRVLPTNTNLPVQYYPQRFQRLQSRCQTYDQKAFNFVSTSATDSNAFIADCNANPEQTIQTNTTASIMNSVAKTLANEGLITPEEYSEYKLFFTFGAVRTFADYAGFLNGCDSPNAYIRAQQVLNPYGIDLANPNAVYGNQCKTTIYKPSNAQYSVQGSVKSSARTNKLHTTTNALYMWKETRRLGPGNVYRGIANPSENPDIPFFLKSKTREMDCTSTNGERLKPRVKKRCYALNLHA